MAALLPLGTSAVSNVESRVFDYNNGNVSQVTLYRGTPASPHQTSVRRVVMTYYDTTVTNKGNLGDLKTVTTQVPQGVGWQDVATNYYRYYTSNSATSYVGGLKYVVGLAAYAELSNPEAASDGQIAAVAQVAYQYDQNTRWITQATSHGGEQTYNLAYTPSSNSDDFNHWQLKTAATMPDGSTKTVLANHVGQDMLVEHQNGGDPWIRYTNYNDEGRVIERAHPSAIDMSGTPYNQNTANLAVQLNSDEGLIDVLTYYGEEDLAPSHLNETKVRNFPSVAHYGPYFANLTISQERAV